MDFREQIRVIEGFPAKGISFKDITTLLKDGVAYKALIDQMADELRPKKIDLVVGPEARGFVIGCPLAYALGVGFVPVRKPGKLPADTCQLEYDLEYGKDMLEVHIDAIAPGQRVAIVDDLIASGGTAFATAKLIESVGGKIVAIRFVMELSELQGMERVNDYDVSAVITY